MPTSDYAVNITVRTKDQTSQPAKKASKGLFTLADAAKAVAGAMVVRQIAKYAGELTELGAAAERQGAALDNLAAAAGTSGDAIIKAIQGASDFTIDKMSAMASANRAMVLDVADSPEQFERLTKVAVSLGRAMGVDATKSIDDFVTAAGRQSKMIADNLGLMVSAEDANRRYAEAMGISVDEMDDAAKKQAFLTEMLRQGEIKMAALGDSTLDTAGQMEQAAAGFKDAKTAIGEMLAAFAGSTGVFDAVASGARNIAAVTQSVKEHGFSVQAWGESMLIYQSKVSEGVGRTEAMNAAYSNYVWAVENADAATEKHTETIRYLNDEYGNITGSVTILQGSIRDINPEIDRYANAIEQSAEVGRWHRQTTEEQVEALGPVPRLTFEAARYLDELAESETIVGNAAQNSASGIDWGRLAIDNLTKSAKEAAAAAQQLEDLKFGMQ